MEVDTAKIKVLERITIAGLQATARSEQVEVEEEEEGTGETEAVINVVLYNNEYYCIDDPLLLENKKKVKVRVITEVQSKDDLYAEYINNNIRNTLNPYQLLLLYKRMRATIRLPLEVKKILDRNLPIDDELLAMLNEHLLRIEEKNKDKPIFISLTVLDAISSILKYIEGGLQKEEILRLINDYLVDYEDKQYVQYPTAEQLVNYVKLLYEEEKEEQKREEERKRIEGLKKQKMQDVKAEVLMIDDKEEAKAKIAEFLSKQAVVVQQQQNKIQQKIPISVSASPSSVPKEEEEEEIRDIYEEEAEEAKEEVIESRDDKDENLYGGTVEIFLAFKFSIPRNDEVKQQIQKAVSRFLNELRRMGIMVEEEQSNLK